MLNATERKLWYKKAFEEGQIPDGWTPLDEISHCFQEWLIDSILTETNKDKAQAFREAREYFISLIGNDAETFFNNLGVQNEFPDK